jgi:hypothetical protein
MSNIEFISHDHFPDDQYTKELVYLEIDGKRFGYVAKVTKNGNMFWDEISIGVNVSGEKKYFKAFKFDSQFLREDILTFLKARSWEKKPTSIIPSTPLVDHAKQYNYTQESFPDFGEPPF